jgi:hypothetical protein
MKKSWAVVFGALSLLTVPFLVSAQTVSSSVNVGASTQQAFLTELQSLQQELGALAATINAMIAAVGGATPVVTASASISSTASSLTLPMIMPPTLGILPGDDGDEDVSSELLQAITPSVSTTTFIALPTVASTTTFSGTSSVASQSIATQMDPACISSLFADNAQCGGLYYCAVNGAYWSTQQCGE